MQSNRYIMENSDETKRLEIKTDTSVVENSAKWAGLKTGMRVLDVGCGTGKTTACLKRIIGDDGEIVGIDRSEERIRFARQQYSFPGVKFECRDMFGSLEELGAFDFIWVRFVLEYYRSRSGLLISSFTHRLSDLGVLCLGDLDHNGLNHFELPERLERAIYGCSQALEKSSDYDPYAGRKLYSYLFDMGFRDIDVRIDAHHLIFGELSSVDEFNWFTKLAVAGKNSGYAFEEYEGGFEEFFRECKDFFYNPRRFTYTPIITCRGIKPSFERDRPQS